MIWGFVFGAMVVITFTTMKRAIDSGRGSYIDIDTPFVFLFNIVAWLILIVAFLCCKLYGGE